MYVSIPQITLSCRLYCSIIKNIVVMCIFFIKQFKTIVNSTKNKSSNYFTALRPVQQV